LSNAAGGPVADGDGSAHDKVSGHVMPNSFGIALPT
jgi:hypothetical protein